ncbi:hypothetical protein [Aquimarina algiphila]|uniref:hypothetical protein n=1 Tax=Aquimarina algiphila TaxID=2047982 RepID=UPI0024908772|nr:hypothetical protein [Aquimarina algiphila]
MNIYIAITSILSVFFLIIVGSVLIRKHKTKKLRKVFNKNQYDENLLRKQGFKPFDFFPKGRTKPSIKVWARNYKEAQNQYHSNLKGGMYGGI